VAVTKVVDTAAGKVVAIVAVTKAVVQAVDSAAVVQAVAQVAQPVVRHRKALYVRRYAHVVRSNYRR
jgi:hypothetical protein